MENVAFHMKELVKIRIFDMKRSEDLRTYRRNYLWMRKNLTTKQLKFMTEKMIDEECDEFYKIYADASKSSDATGVGITDTRFCKLAIGMNSKVGGFQANFGKLNSAS